MKRWFRRKYLIWKYRHNYGTGKLIVTKASDRGLGLTTLMLEDCLKNKYKLFVPNEMARRNMIMTLSRMMYNPRITTTDNPADYIVTLHDIGTRGNNSDIKIVVDNSCAPYDINLLAKTECEIVNGFVHYSMAA